MNLSFRVIHHRLHKHVILELIFFFIFLIWLNLFYFNIFYVFIMCSTFCSILLDWLIYNILFPSTFNLLKYIFTILCIFSLLLSFI